MLLIIWKNWKQPKCLLIEEWLNNLGHINTKKYCEADKKWSLYIIITYTIPFTLHIVKLIKQVEE